jgi:ketosteroid isomerase-like protein
MRFTLRAQVFILLLTASSVLAQQKDREETKIINLIKQMTEAQLRYDAPALGEFDPREKVLGFYAPEANPGDKFKGVVEAVSISLRRYGKFAVMITQLDYQMTMDGKQLPPRSIRATFVCMKEKGQWKIASAQYTGIRPAGNPPVKTN